MSMLQAAIIFILAFGAPIFGVLLMCWLSERRKISIGTKSLLFGAHQFIIHPLAVAYAWKLLYGFPWDPRLWVAFIVHDWGYWGKPNMDGPAGTDHPRLGANIMHALFDWPRHEITHSKACSIFISNYKWHIFTGYHSARFAAGNEVSKLWAPDKLALVVTPRWLYLAMVRASGEWREYAAETGHTDLKAWYSSAVVGTCRGVFGREEV